MYDRLYFKPRPEFTGDNPKVSKKKKKKIAKIIAVYVTRTAGCSERVTGCYMNDYNVCILKGLHASMMSVCMFQVVV